MEAEPQDEVQLLLGKALSKGGARWPQPARELPSLSFSAGPRRQLRLAGAGGPLAEAAAVAQCGLLGRRPTLLLVEAAPQTGYDVAADNRGVHLRDPYADDLYRMLRAMEGASNPTRVRLPGSALRAADASGLQDIRRLFQRAAASGRGADVEDGGDIDYSDAFNWLGLA